MNGDVATVDEGNCTAMMLIRNPPLGVAEQNVSDADSCSMFKVLGMLAKYVSCYLTLRHTNETRAKENKPEASKRNGAGGDGSCTADFLHLHIRVY